MTNDSLRQLAFDIIQEVWPPKTRTQIVDDVEQALIQVDAKARREGFQKGVNDSAEIAANHNVATPGYLWKSCNAEIFNAILALLKRENEYGS